MNIESLKREMDELRRRLDLADAEVKNIYRQLINAQRSVSMLERNPANREKIEEARREVQIHNHDYDSVSRHYYSIFYKMQSVNIELTEAERMSMNSSYRR